MTRTAISESFKYKRAIKINLKRGLMMVSHKNHKFFIGFTAVIILIIGLFLGFLLAAKLEIIDLEIINMGLTFTSIVLILFTGSLILEIKEHLLKQSQKRGKK